METLFEIDAPAQLDQCGHTKPHPHLGYHWLCTQVLCNGGNHVYEKTADAVHPG